jgi:hypothetical protein
LRFHPLGVAPGARVSRRAAVPPLTIVDAVHAPHLFRAWFQPLESWSAWLVVLRAEWRGRPRVERESGQIIPWVFHRQGRPIEYFRRSWARACYLAGVEIELVK